MRPAERTTVNTPRLAGVVRSSSSVAALNRRDRVVITSCILLISALAWAYLAHLDGQMSSSVDHEKMANMGMVMDAPWGATDVFFTFMMWAVMMVGMMSASAAPVLLLFADMHVRRAEGGLPIAVLMFGLGYITVWLGFSAFAAVAQWALHEAALLSSGMALSSPRLAGAVLITAGVYQLTPAKGACLTKCQSPLGFLMSNWRDGVRGAFRIGLRHGAYCLGCCWALMCVLFAVGVMNLSWVAVLSAFILAEKIARTGVRVQRIGGVIMAAFGVLLVTK